LKKKTLHFARTIFLEWRLLPHTELAGWFLS